MQTLEERTLSDTYYSHTIPQTPLRSQMAPSSLNIYMKCTLLPCTDVYYLFERQCHQYKILLGYKELDLYDYVEVRTSTITTSNPRLNRLASSSIRLRYFDK